MQKSPEALNVGGYISVSNIRYLEGAQGGDVIQVPFRGELG